MLSPQELSFILQRLVDPNRGLRPLVVSAPTGSGKSTRIGLTLSLRYPEKSVWVVVPTTLAVNNLFNWAINMKSELKIGLRAGGRSQGADIDTAQLFYTTTGTLIDILFKALDKLRINADPSTATKAELGLPQVKLPDFLVLDEIHLRRIDEFLAMALWQRLIVFQHGVGPRLLLTSATVDPQQQYEQASDFLGLDTKNGGQFPDARPRQNDFIVINSELPITNVPEERDFRSVYDQQRFTTMLSRAREWTNRFPILSSSKMPGRGNILLLVPGIEDAKSLNDKGQQLIKQYSMSSVSIMLFHAGITGPEKQGQLNELRRLPGDKVVWIISTAMGTTSLTFPHLRVVIDSMLVKRRTIDSATSNVVVKTELVSREEYIQRRGRVGRTMSGHYVPMMTQQKLDELSTSGRSEVEYLPLSKISLRLILHRINPDDIWQTALTSGISLTSRWDLTQDELLRLKLITDQHELTPAGRFVIQTSFQIRPAVLLWKWIHKNLPPWPGIILTALIDNYGPYWALRKQRNQTPDDYARQIQTQYARFYLSANDDVNVLLNMWVGLMENTNYMLAYLTPTPIADQNPEYRKQISNEARMLSRAVQKLKLDSNNIRKLVYQVKHNAEVVFRWSVRHKRNNFIIAKFDPQEVTTIARSLYKKVYYDRVLKRERNYYLNTDGQRYYLDSSSVMRQYEPQELITLSTLQIKQSRFARLGVTTDKLKKLTDPRLPKSTTSQVQAPRRILSRSKIPVDPDASVNYTPDKMLIYQQNIHLRQALKYRTSDIARYTADQIGLGNMNQLLMNQNMIIPKETVGGKFEYQPRNKEMVSVIQWGQRKLFCAVFEFLLLASSSYPQALVVYIGAAPGTNIRILHQYFPDLKWHLYDPRDFAPELKDLPQVQIFKQLFTDADAQKYVSRNYPILLISDIRQGLVSTSEDKGPNIQNEQKIVQDLQLQKRWVEMIQPVFSHLKFRMPFIPGETEYFTGLGIFTQPWTKYTSTETRMVVSPIDSSKPVGQRQFSYRMYNHNAYEQALYRYNTILRTSYFDDQTVTVKMQDQEHSQIDHCFDCFQETSLWVYYFESVRGMNKEQALLQVPAAVASLTQMLGGDRRNLLTY